MSKDPTGLFAISTIMSNLPQGIPGDDEYGIGGQDHNAHKMRWGLLALLITANEGDYFRLGALELENKQGPSIGYYKWNMFWMVNCDTIMVGNQRLEDFYRNEVERQRSPLIWWRDSSASYYQLAKYGSSLSNPQAKTFIDGAKYIDLPDYHSINIDTSLLLGVGFDLVVDRDGSIYLSISKSAGASAGVSYTESYLSYTGGVPIGASISKEELINDIQGICVHSSIQLLIGILGNLCSYDKDKLLGFSTEVATYSVGVAAGISPVGLNGTILLPIPRQPTLGWRTAITDRLNGITHENISQSVGW